VTFDVILRGGWVVDGSGAPPWRADVGVQADRIAAVGRLGQVEGRMVLDVPGKYIFPGFVDAHVHADLLFGQPDVQEASLRQGVTTFIVGQDGLSHAPAPAPTAAYVREYFGAVNGLSAAGVRLPQPTIAEALSQAESASAVNLAWLVPAGTVRHQVMGPADREPTAAELSQMRSIVAAGMADGAVGLSTGLDYLPGRYADTAEIAALCEPVAEAGGVYVSHMRGYDVTAPQGMAEVRAIADRARVPVHVSHYFGPGLMLTRLIDDARDAGVDVTFDSYPYLRGATILAMAALPPEVQQGGVAETLRRLKDRSVRERLKEQWFPAIADRLYGITLSFVADGGHAWAEGMSLEDAAARAGVDLAEFVCDLLVASDLAVSCVRAERPTNGEQDVRALLRHEAQMGGSDGIFVGSVPHPRGWGTFARFLGRHVRELGDWTWAQAGVHLAGHPARRFGLPDRGLIRTGYVADLAVIDPLTVADQATYDEPRRPAVGVRDVLVGGVFVLRDGELTGATPGRGLRRDGSGGAVGARGDFPAGVQ
jgi:N-acyl-D-amino-acid deacylase